MLYGQPGDIWRQQFIEDTEVAASIFCAMDEGRLQFAFETICHATGAETVDYCEALLCERIAGATTRVRLGSLVPALERLGLVRRLDRWVVNSIIKALRADPDARLGCNISAHSARLDAWWAAILNTLSEEPDIARRLIVEITETAPLTEFEEAREFVRVLRSLGCRVALDDVGNGYSSVKNLLCLGVDIAKIDRTFVRDAFGEETARARLRHLVEFAKTCAPSVVVEGVETEVDACVARGCGATFLQGFLFRG
ncbi:EAL domain-containing protein (putative c-di-GMP-specific phosphodiesterase class I) [Paraburkholderia sp. BL6665CI2N2]|nr:EAL domain-containing protein (putative c-di-GMP-specific phosphodiesterase class I) [Paraburkholderia sp. BL6665CI2N2]